MKKLLLLTILLVSCEEPGYNEPKIENVSMGLIDQNTEVVRFNDKENNVICYVTKNLYNGSTGRGISCLKNEH